MRMALQQPLSRRVRMPKWLVLAPLPPLPPLLLPSSVLRACDTVG